MDTCDPVEKRFCSGLEYLVPWLELADYCRRLLCHTFDIQHNDYYLAAASPHYDAELMAKHERVHAAKRDLDLFYRELKQKFIGDEYACYRITNEYSSFQADWNKFVRSYLYRDLERQ
jgi:hypothetical protein